MLWKVTRSRTRSGARRLSPAIGRAAMIMALTAAGLLPAACSTASPPPPRDGPNEPVAAPDAAARDAAAPDAEAVRQEYLRLTQQALDEVRSWSSGDGRNPDPRPVWARRMEEFAKAHPGSPEAAEAISGVMQLRARMRDREGFFRDYDLLLSVAPDAPAVAGVFPQVSAMRMAEAGGRDGFDALPYRLKQRVWRRAVPRIVADMQRAMAATGNPATLAAAEYTMGLSWYQLDIDLARAREHFEVVAEKYPTWTYAESAREYIREIRTLAAGKPAPDFEAVAIDGRKVKLSSLAGKIVLVDFWATWCQPCLSELPGLKRAYEKYRRAGFVIVGVSADTDGEALARFVAKERVGWPVIAADPGGENSTEPLFRAYSVQAIPMSYLIDRSGKIRGRALFGEEVERTVGDLIDR